MDGLVQHESKFDGLVQHAKEVSLNSNVNGWVGPACQESKFKQ
jgi:hypothetical protein